MDYDIISCTSYISISNKITFHINYCHWKYRNQAEMMTPLWYLCFIIRSTHSLVLLQSANFKSIQHSIQTQSKSMFYQNSNRDHIRLLGQTSQYSSTKRKHKQNPLPQSTRLNIHNQLEPQSLPAKAIWCSFGIFSSTKLNKNIEPQS